MMLSDTAAHLGQTGHTGDAPVHPADPVQLSGWTIKVGLKRTFYYFYFTQGELLFLRGEGG